MLLLLPILISRFIQIRGWGMRKDMDNTGERRVKREQTAWTVWSPEGQEHYSKSWTKPGHVHNCCYWGYRNPDPHDPSGRLNITSTGVKHWGLFLGTPGRAAAQELNLTAGAIRHSQTSAGFGRHRICIKWLHVTPSKTSVCHLDETASIFTLCFKHIIRNI